MLVLLSKQALVDSSKSTLLNKLTCINIFISLSLLLLLFIIIIIIIIYYYDYFFGEESYGSGFSPITV